MPSSGVGSRESASEFAAFPSVDIEHWFKTRDHSNPASKDGKALHLKNLHARLKTIRPDMAAELVGKLRCLGDVVIEKAAIYRFYQAIARGRQDIDVLIDEIANEMKALQDGEENTLGEVVSHYRGDFWHRF